MPHHDLTSLDGYFTSVRSPRELGALLEEAQHLLVRLVVHEPNQAEAVADIHLALYELNFALRKTKPLHHGDTGDKG